jgi:transposase InsO family protein
VSRKRVARLMRQDGLRARQPRRFITTTDSRFTSAPAPNLLARDFKPRRPDRIWVGDVTYIPTKAGWLFLAVLLDLGSRRVVGWATSTKNDTTLAVAALRKAIAHRRVRRRLIHHTDQGSPYASFEYQTLLLAQGIRPSMSRRGDCFDNAVAESFFATLKNEVDLTVSGFPDTVSATRSIGEYIDGYYNSIRRHSTLGYISPVEFERRMVS